MSPLSPSRAHQAHLGAAHCHSAAGHSLCALGCGRSGHAAPRRFSGPRSLGPHCRQSGPPPLVRGRAAPRSRRPGPPPQLRRGRLTPPPPLVRHGHRFCSVGEGGREGERAPRDLDPPRVRGGRDRSGWVRVYFIYIFYGQKGSYGIYWARPIN